MFGGETLTIKVGVGSTIQVGDVLTFNDDVIQEKDITVTAPDVTPLYFSGTATTPTIEVKAYVFNINYLFGFGCIKSLWHRDIYIYWNVLSC